MISRLIEAKPDEMRVYLEEAAGISKYKERRRETENRIQHTKENLERLNDVRNELDKQLNTLKRQASAAERFKVLKEEERNLRPPPPKHPENNLENRKCKKHVGRIQKMSDKEGDCGDREDRE